MKIVENMLWENDSCYDLRQIVGVEVIKEWHSRMRGYYPDNYCGWQLYIVTMAGAHLKLGEFAEMPATHKIVNGNWIDNGDYKSEDEIRKPLLQALGDISHAINLIRK